MSIDTKNDLDIRCDAVQKVSTAIAKLRTEDIEKVAAFVLALKNGQKITIADDIVPLTDKKDIIELSDRSHEIESYLERLHIALDDLLMYFNRSEEDLKNKETCMEVIYEFDLNRVRLDVVTDYIVRIREAHKIIVNAVRNIESQVENK